MSATIDRITVVTPDMSCNHCVAAIQGDLGALTGVQSVKADLATKRVTVEFDPAAVTIPAIEAALDDAGYPVAK